MSLGPHAAFIGASWAIAALALALLIGWLVRDGRRQQAMLDDLEDRGIRRRSAGGGDKRSASGKVDDEIAGGPS